MTDLDARGSAAMRRVLHAQAPAPDWTHGGDAPEWMSAAVCASTDPDVFFPEKGGSTREAKSVCRGCPVAADCLAFALEHVERFGIWGGLSERERRRLPAAASRTPLGRRRTDDDGDCSACGLAFRSVRRHRARSAACRAATAGAA